MSVDPLAEKYNWMSNYQFSSNQVVHAPEIEGMESYDDLNDRDLDHNTYPVYGTDVYNGGDEQIHNPKFDLEEVIVLAGFDGMRGNADDRAGVDQRDDVEAIDLVDYGIGGLGEANGLAQRLWQGSSNASQWSAAYRASKTLGVGASALKNGVNPALTKVGTGLAYASALITATKIATSGQVQASDVLSLSVTAIGLYGGPMGAGFATAFFAADLITLAISGESIGTHLDRAVGQPLIDAGYGNN